MIHTYIKLLDEALNRHLMTPSKKREVIKDFARRVLEWEENEKICKIKKDSEIKNIRIMEDITIMIPD
jgi:hypothetical protein